MLPLYLSLSIIALYVSFNWQGMIFNPLKNKLDSLLPYHLAMPLYRCPICMSSTYTMLYYIIEGHCTLSPFHFLLLLLTVAGINVFLCILLNHTTDYGC